MHKIDFVSTTIAREKHGLVIYDDLLNAGYDRNQIHYYFKSAHIENVSKGIYFNTIFERTQKTEILANILRSPGKAAASHLTALYLYGLIEKIKNIELVVHCNVKHAVTRAQLYRTQDFDDLKLNIIDAIPTVTLERALISSFVNFNEYEFGQMVSNALINKQTTVKKLNAELQRQTRVFGKKNMTKLFKQLEFELQGIESVFELRVARVIEQFNLEKPVRQHKVKLDGHNFRLDFAYPQYKIYIEADGFKYHSSDGDFVSDRRRQNILSIHGWKVIRLTPRMSDEEIAQYIANMLEINIY